MPEIYLIIADASQARLLHAASKESPLTEVQTVNHPEGKLHSRELTSDLAGHGSNHVGAGRHKMDSPTDPKVYEQELFARQIAELLHKLEEQKRIDQLMLAASPAMLGMLRKHINSRLASLITIELDKNLIQLRTDELRDHFPYFKPVERVMS